MGDAFAAAWAGLNDAGYNDVAADWAREVLALRIIETAQGGETDVNRLRDDALTHLANLRVQKKRA
jgi:hypothetical protein